MDSERTLRSEFRYALDEVLPPAPWLESTVAEDLRKRRSGRSMDRGPGRSGSARRRPADRATRRWLVGVRGAGAIAAVLLVVFLIATLFVGGRVWQDWTRFRSQPAPAGRSSILAELRARPLRLPVVARGGTCPSTPTTVIDYLGNVSMTAYGSGPVYGVGGPQTTTAWGDYYDVTYVTEPQLTGIVLIRIRDLESTRVGVFVGPYATGAVVGTDTIDGKAVQQHADLVLDASHHPTNSGSSKWGIWSIRQGLAAGWSHCFGIQVDSAGFSEISTGNG